MTESELLAWFENLDKRGAAIPSGAYRGYRRSTDALAWLAEAETALCGTFPPGHSMHSTWRAIFERAKTHLGIDALGIRRNITEPYADDHFEQAQGVIKGAIALIRDGRLRGIFDGVRAETVVEVLDQAMVLLSEQYTVAAAVLAGGALETHLRHLCERNALTWQGDGSITKYNDAIAQARNKKTAEVYGATDSKSVTAWGGTRNDAAHDPTNFAHSADAVGLMIEGIRQFIARTS